MLCGRSVQRPVCKPIGGITRPVPRVRASVRRRCMQLSAVAAPAAPGAIPVDASKVKRMRLLTQKDCELGVSIYPKFAYNATNGGGWADATEIQPGILQVTFNPQTVVIPALNWRTATLFMVPIPPPLDIEIVPQRLEGTVNTITGEVLLEFDAEFNFTASSLYKAPPLIVKTQLTTGYTKGRFREGTGQPFNGFKGRLAGTATVEKTGDWFMDNFLMLPSDALAIMSAELIFE